MSSDTSTIEVFILDKPYRISCPESEQESLRQSAQYLDRKMREIRAGGKVLGLERIAVIAALNISHELISASRQADAESVSQSELSKLIAKIENTLDQYQTLDV